MRSFLAAALFAAAAPVLVQTAVQPTPAQPDAAATFLAANRARKGVVETPSGLQYQVLFAGEPGKRPGDDAMALVIYEGKLTNGTTFDKSPWFTPMPVAGVVPGFAEALKLMPAGARYRFWIKPDLAYGAQAQKDGSGREIIPANSVLVFDIRMLDFLSGPAYQALISGAVPSGN